MKKYNLADLIGKYGSPLYVFDDKAFVVNYNHLCNAFRNEYGRYVPGYSYKTNYTPHICMLVKSLGGYAEVVSDMELYVAKRIGYDNNKIIYNGPCKGEMMEEHILNGGISNIDNEEEAIRVIELAKQHPEKNLKIGLRINTDIGAGFISRFGIEPDSPTMARVVDMIKAQPNLQLVGLHMHVSRARYIEAWQKRIDNILAVADKIIDITPEYIDLGSGMFADMEDYLKNQFTIKVPSFEEYAKVVAGTMARHYADSKKKPILISEPGTTVVSRYLSLITTVKAIKELRGRNIAIVDCDIHNAGETCQMMKVPYTHFMCGEGESLNAPLDITGFTCLEQDTLFKDFPENVKVGDILELRNVGGYSVVYKPPFIQPCCAMIAIKEDGSIAEIKRKETFEDIFQTYKF
ncbi:alanine racemase [Bacteroides ovatus]|uniref:alanine racemase n=1 Tax=Bacteroides ovatus TaxID=28116 RepID=UPI0018C91E22|nr:alanine racemase [Bacteroides ovatus]MBG9220338.1 alanine racemase [Bacteroides ovatus]MBG9233464.1 alanine racemase [Bacteroides ovatus]